MKNKNELIIVIVIVAALVLALPILAILAGMFLPALNQAKEKAKQADCTAKLSQIGKASFQYAMSYDDYYPSKSTSAQWRGSNSGYSLDLLRQADLLSDPMGYICPSQPVIRAQDPYQLRSQGVVGHVSYNWCDKLEGGNATLSAVCADAFDNHSSTGRFVRGDGSVDVAYGVKNSNGGKGWQGDSKFDKFANAGGTRQWIIGK